jgi:hypothetical protein
MSPYNSAHRNLNCLLNFFAAILLAQIANAQSAAPIQSQDSTSPPQPAFTEPVLADPSQITGPTDY